MSPDSEPSRRAPSAAELDAEREVDFSRYARALAARWWLLLAGLLVGAGIGFALGQSESSTFQAQATLYLGQPLSATGSSSVPTIASDPTGVATIARSESVIREVAAEVGISPRELRRGVSAAALGERNRQTNVALIGVTVRGEDADTVERAANLLAETLVDRASTYASAKIETLERQLDSQRAQVETLTSRIEDVSATLEQGGDASSTERLTLLNFLALLETQRSSAADRVLSTEQLVTIAQEVEHGTVVSEASAARVDARSARTSTVVGGFLGLLVGALVALLWSSVSRPRPA